MKKCNVFYKLFLNMILGHTTDLLVLKQCSADAFFISAIHAIHFGLENMLIDCCFLTPILLNNTTVIILLEFLTPQAILSHTWRAQEISREFQLPFLTFYAFLLCHILLLHRAPKGKLLNSISLGKPMHKSC